MLQPAVRMPWSSADINVPALVLPGPWQSRHLCALHIQGSVRTGDNAMATIDRVAVAMARAEALPQDELRRTNPRERTLEDVRLEQPELTVGCWASG